MKKLSSETSPSLPLRLLLQMACPSSIVELFVEYRAFRTCADHGITAALYQRPCLKLTSLQNHHMASWILTHCGGAALFVKPQVAVTGNRGSPRPSLSTGFLAGKLRLSLRWNVKKRKRDSVD
jgi:hypothetical protein